MKRIWPLATALTLWTAMPVLPASAQRTDLASWRAAADRARATYESRDFRAAQALYALIPKNCPATPDECRKVTELSWLSSAGVADALLR